MRNVRAVMLTASAVVLAVGCATTDAPPAPRIEPVVRVTHGAAQAMGYYELGRYHHAQKRLPQAIEAYRKALAGDDRSAALYNALGMALAAAGDLDGAVAAFTAAAGLEPSAARFLNNLGYALQLKGDDAAAIRAFEQSLALDPANPRTWNNLGTSLARQGEGTRAEEAHARAESMSANGVPLQQARGDRARVAPAVVTLALAVDPQGPPVGGDAPARIAKEAMRLDVMPWTALPPEGAGRPVSSPAAWAAGPSAAASVVIEVPTSASLKRVAPGVLELDWATTALIALPAPSSGAAIPASFGLEIANGNGITGYARRVRGLLSAVGLPNARLANHKAFDQATTEIQYRAGFAAAAQTLRARVVGEPAIVASDQLRGGIDVRLLLGHDLPQDVALVVPSAQQPRRADAAPVSRAW